MFTKIKDTIIVFFPVVVFVSGICADRDTDERICTANEAYAFSHLQSPVNFEQCSGINHIIEL